MAQDFFKAFKLGDDDKSIAAIDSDGVALAAVKAQQDIIVNLKAEVDLLRKELDDIKLVMTSSRNNRHKKHTN